MKNKVQTTQQPKFTIPQLFEWFAESDCCSDEKSLLIDRQYRSRKEISMYCEIFLEGAINSLSDLIRVESLLYCFMGKNHEYRNSHEKVSDEQINRVLNIFKVNNKTRDWAYSCLDGYSKEVFFKNIKTIQDYSLEYLNYTLGKYNPMISIKKEDRKKYQLYFAESSNELKIGISKNVSTRVKSLKGFNLLHTKEASEKNVHLEKEILCRYLKHKTQGEYFKNTLELKNEIINLYF